MHKEEFENYWVKSGGSKVFLKYLAKSNFELTDLSNTLAHKDRMEDVFSEEDPIPLLFQCGYLTIVGTEGDLFRLGIPNGEVRSALAAAVRQIESRGYALPWKADNRKVFKIGVVFDPETRNITNWEAIEQKN